MSLVSRITSLASRIAQEFKALKNKIVNHNNVIIKISYTDLGISDGSQITNEIMANYIASLEMPIELNTNYYFEVSSGEVAAESLTVFISPITQLVINDDRTSYFPIYLTIGGQQYILEDNALFTPDEAGIRAFYTAYVALLNTVTGIAAIIDESQDFTAGMESNLLIKLEIDSAVFEGDFSLRWADSDDYGNDYYAIIGFTYNELNASFYANAYGAGRPEEITSMKFFNKSTFAPFSAYGEPVDITLLKNE